MQTNDAKAKGISNCPLCAKNNIKTIYELEAMQGDHIIPWSQGGKTVEDNLQMLCQKCNNSKSDN